MYVYIYTVMCIYVCIFICMFKDILIFMYNGMYIFILICMYKGMYISILLFVLFYGISNLIGHLMPNQVKENKSEKKFKGAVLGINDKL